MKKIIVSIMIVTLLLSLAGCSSEKPKQVRDSAFVLDTIVTLIVYAYEDQYVPMEEAFAKLHELEDLFSKTRSGSDVYRINENAGIKPVEVHPWVIENIHAAIDYHRLSQGYFDITVGSLVNLWDFSGEYGEVPNQEDIDVAIGLVGMENIVIEGNTVFLKKPGAKIDLGGIAKGFIADVLADFFKENGIESGIINLGGNILTFGEKPDGSQWIIGVQDPFSARGNQVIALHVDEKSLVTSGVYERYFIQNDTVYHHILDPFTGYPMISDLISVTIVSDLSIDGDALSTAIFCLGLEKGMALVEEMEDMEAVFFTQDETMHFSSGIGETIRLEYLD